jgi:DNA replication protein DnaC
VTALERRLTGEHELGKGKRVRVIRAKALAQPADAMMHYGLLQSKVAQVRKERSLIIDQAGARSTGSSRRACSRSRNAAIRFPAECPTSCTPS